GLASVFSNRTSRKSASRTDSDSMADGEGYRNPTEVQMSQLVLPCHTNQRGELSVGQLLKWIDATACLSAERHAGCPCVTASMDDIYFEHTISVGQVVNIKAKVNRAFNSSMEVGIQVASEDLCSEKQWCVCKALATFVAHRELSKVKLKPTLPRTEEEKTEHSVAAERRRMRLVYADTIKDLLANCVIQDDLESRDCSHMVPAEKTRVESVELVLPPHANHQGNTFGGQIMAWMENVATIAASRLCRAHPTLKAIEMFHFRGPSQVGDRLVLKAIVNNAFKHSMEVGVCVEAYRQEAETHRRHINSAFMTFVVLGADDQPQMLPWIRPQPGVILCGNHFRSMPAHLCVSSAAAFCVPTQSPWPHRGIILSFLRLHPSTSFWTLVDYDGYSISSKGFLPTFIFQCPLFLPFHTVHGVLMARILKWLSPALIQALYTVSFHPHISDPALRTPWHPHWQDSDESLWALTAHGHKFEPWSSEVQSGEECCSPQGAHSTSPAFQVDSLPAELSGKYFQEQVLCSQSLHIGEFDMLPWWLR
ncbi:hypothetical protein FD755_001057, partial [Muntiacus reevesi]